MKLLINFLSGTEYSQDLVRTSAATVSKVFSDPVFLARVSSIVKYDFTTETSAQVAETIRSAGEVKVNVGFYRGWFWSRAIAYEQDGAIYFNTRKFGYGAGGVENVAHEVMHALGYSHRGNSPAGNENTVPWKVGQMAAQFIKDQAAGYVG